MTPHDFECECTVCDRRRKARAEAFRREMAEFFAEDSEE